MHPTRHEGHWHPSLVIWSASGKYLTVFFCLEQKEEQPFLRTED